MPIENTVTQEKSRLPLIIPIVLVAVVVIGGAFYLLMKKTMAPTAAPTLQGAIRPGSPDWEKYSKQIALDDPEADESPRALGDIVMTLHTTARNFTGRTITGLEVRAAVLDHQDHPVKEEKVVVIPVRKSELDPNKTMQVSITIYGFTEADDRAKIKMEVTGFKF
jgi:hypothetical protein